MPQYKVTDHQTGRTYLLTGDGPPPTEQELTQIFASQSAPQAQAAPTPPPAPERTWTDTLVDALPAAGATLGGIAGAVGGGLPTLGLGAFGGGVAAAGVGGAAGETLKQYINGLRGKEAGFDTNSTLERAKDILGEGLWDAGLEAVGGGIAKGLGAVAKGATRMAFRPAAQAMEINPGLIDDILKRGLTLDKEGVQAAKGFTDDARMEAEAMVKRQMQRPNVRFKPNGSSTYLNSNRANVMEEIINPVFSKTASLKNPSMPNAMGKVAQGFEQTPDIRTAARMADNIITDNPKEIGLDALLAAKRREGTLAGKVWKGDTPNIALKKGLHADLANAADAALERRLGPGWKEANAVTQKNLTTQKVIEDAVKKSAEEGTSISP